jgi:hypothetical protein
MDFPYNRRIMESCGLTSLPDRRTFDRRLSTISDQLGKHFLTRSDLIFAYRGVVYFDLFS